MRFPLFLASLVALAACDPDAGIRQEPGPLPPRAAGHVAPLIAAGDAAAVTAAADQNLQWAASVVQIDPVPGQDARLFGLAGGDPAMNGLQTYVAFFIDPANGWRVFPIGDFLSYRLLRTEKGRVDLEVRESTLDAASGRIGERTRRLIVAWTPGAGDSAPTTVTAAPAR